MNYGINGKWIFKYGLLSTFGFCVNQAMGILWSRRIKEKWRKFTSYYRETLLTLYLTKTAICQILIEVGMLDYTADISAIKQNKRVVGCILYTWLKHLFFRVQHLIEGSSMDPIHVTKTTIHQGLTRAIDRVAGWILHLI